MIAELAEADESERSALLGVVGTPIQRGPLTTFVHLGDADSVGVKHFMALFPPIPALRPIVPGLQAVTVRLPEGARVEYKLSVSIGDQTDVDVDPFNSRLATDPHGANSVAFAYGYVEPPWVAPRSGSKGVLRRGFVESKAFGHRRSVQWYHPAEPSGLMPLLVVHDGSDFVHHAGIVDVLDNLIADRVIPPLVAALIDSPDRLVEYTDDRRHAAYVNEVIGAAVRRHGAHPDRARHVYLGASMGGVAALSAAWRMGGTGGLVLLSGSFVTALGGPMQRGEQFARVIDFMERFTDDPGHPAARIYQAWGEYEGLVPDNRAFAPILEGTGAQTIYQEVPDGHHWHNWRDRLGEALSHTFSGLDAVRSVTVRS